LKIGKIGFASVRAHGPIQRSLDHCGKASSKKIAVALFAWSIF
jgi:hypothetical protein